MVIAEDEITQKQVISQIVKVTAFMNNKPSIVNPEDVEMFDNETRFIEMPEITDLDVLDKPFYQSV